MEEQWPGQPVAANDSGAWPGQPEQQQEQPSTRGRLQPLIGQLTPEEPQRGNFAAADAALNLTSQEKALYQRHLTNLTGPGGVDNPDGSRSTLFQAVQEHNGRFYNIPTVWNGRIETEEWTRPSDNKKFQVPNQTAIANVEREGWNTFPSYATPEEADERYDKMHGFMERDTAAYFASRNESLLERLPRYGLQLIAADKYLLDTNRYWDDTVSNFTAGIKGVEDAINAAEDKNRPWYERGIAAVGQVPYAVGMTAVSSITGPSFQAVGGALEKLTGGAYSSEEFQAAMMIPGIFGGAKYAELKEPPPFVKLTPIRPIEGSPAQVIPTWYHGTDKSFETFDLNAVRSTMEPDIAIAFSSSEKLASGHGKRIISANLNLKNPKIIEKESWTTRGEQADEIDQAKREGHDGIIYKYTGDHSYIDPNNPHPSEALVWTPGTISEANTGKNLLLPRSETARTGIPEVDAVLNHPIIHSVLDNAVINDTHEIPNSWGGSVPLDNPVTYRDKDFPKTLTIPRQSTKPVLPDSLEKTDEGTKINIAPKGMEVPEWGKGLTWGLTAYRTERNGISALQVRDARLPPEMQGQGLGLQMYQHLADQAQQEGRQFQSDGTVTQSAINVWSRLKQLGYDVKTADNKQFRPGPPEEPALGRYETPDGSPLFWIEPKPPGTVTFDTAEPAIIHENVEEFVIDKLMEGGMSRDAALRAAYWGWGNPAEHAWYRAHGMDPDHVEAALRPYLDKIASRKANEANIPADLFRETYPDGNPLKATSGEIEKPTPEEAARAQEIIRNNTGPRITGGTVDKPDVRVAQDLGIIGPERPSINEGTPEEAARNAVPAITAYHGSPYSFDAFDMGKIGTGEGAQSYGHGLYFAENPDVAQEYRNNLANWKIGDKPADPTNPSHIAAITLKAYNGDAGKAIADLTNTIKAGPASERADAAKAIELIRNGSSLPEVTGGNFYQVRIHADPEHFLDRDKPLNEQPQNVQDVAKKLGVKLPPQDNSGQIFHSVVRNEFAGGSSEETTNILRQAGIRGIKYLDQGSRRLSDEAITKELDESARDLKYSQKMGDMNKVAEIQDRMEHLQAQLKRPQTSNYVVFDHNDVEITHRNGEPVKPRTPPTPPPKPEQPSADSWRARFEHFVDRIQTADDIKQLIRNAADENQNFLAARRGDIPLAQVEKIADASGMDTAEVLKSGVGRQLRNDDQVDLAMRIMLRTTDSAKDMAKQLMTDQSDQNFIKFQEALMRRDLAVEQIIGLRAEWGRTGNVFQKFMKEVKDGQALDKFISETCPL